MKIHELGHVVLYVRSIEISANFYRDTLGFRELMRAPGMAVFSGGRTHHELLLLEVGGAASAQRPPSPGLYHIGFKVGNSTQELREAYHELMERGVRIVGMSDHHVTHSLYVLDPDDNELELYVDISDIWKTDPTAVLAPTRPLRL